MCRMLWKSGRLNLLEPSGPHRACYGTALSYLLYSLVSRWSSFIFSICQLTLNLLTTTIVTPHSNASKWQMGFNSAFKGLICIFHGHTDSGISLWSIDLIEVTTAQLRKVGPTTSTDWTSYFKRKVFSPAIEVFRYHHLSYFQPMCVFVVRVNTTYGTSLISFFVYMMMYNTAETCSMWRRKAWNSPRKGHEDPEGEQIYSSTLTSTSALDGGGWSTPRPGRFTSGKDPVPIV